MKPACRDRVATVLGRPVGETEANFIESRIVQSMKTLSRQERASWFALSETERLTRAAAHAADEIVANARAALEGQQTETLDQVKRGDFTIYREGFGQGMAPRIRLFAAADRSTFLHESAHFFLEMLRALAEAPDATASIKSMYADTRTWMGLADGARIEREHHELFARTFEAYLMEGKAPSLKLRKVFAEFARWLKGVYQSLLGLEQQAGEVRLSDDIRSVFDRMLATDQELERARAAMGAGQFTQEQLGLNDADYAAYLDSIETAQEAEETALRAQAIDGYMKQKRAEWKRREAQWRRTKTLEINGQPVYRALEWLARGRWLPGHASPVAESAPEVDGQADTLDQPLPPRLRGEPTTLSRTPPAELPDPGSQEYADMLASARAKEAVYGTPALTELEKRIVRQNRDSEGETFAQFVPAAVADPEAMDEALQALAAGMDPETVRVATGVFESMEGIPTVEIDDSKAQIDAAEVIRLQKAGVAAFDPQDPFVMRADMSDPWVLAKAIRDGDPEFSARVKLHTLVQHEELFRKLPWTRDLDVVFWAEMPALNADGTALGRPFDGSGDPAILVTTDPHSKDPAINAEKVLETVMHELQHVIQMHYLYNLGGDPNTAMDFFRLLTPEARREIVDQMRAIGLSPRSKDSLYRMLIGEIGAWDTQGRLRMSAAERMAIPPRISYMIGIPTFRWTPGEHAAFMRMIGAKMAGSVGLAQRDPAAPFYSALERTVAESKTTKASAAQWKATLAKTPGLKKEELEWTGVLDWLDGQEAAVTRESLLDFVRANGVRVEETVKGGGAQSAKAMELEQYLLPLIERRDAILAEPDGSKIRNIVETISNRGGLGQLDDMLSDGDINAEVYERAKNYYELQGEINFTTDELKYLRQEDDTKWSSFTLPGGSNYREMLLRLPEQTRSATLDEINAERAKVSSRLAPITQEQYDRMVADGEVPQKNVSGDAFRSSHWDEPNVLAHVRFKERTDADGKRTLAIEEVQSDWGQTLRKEKEARAKYIDANLDSIVKRMKDAGVLTEVCD